MTARTLIVGAGIAGLCTALALRRLGARIDVVERQPGGQPAGTGIFIPANGMRAFAALGVADALLGCGQVITRMRAGSADASVEGVADLGSVWSNVAACLAVRRADLHRVLAAAADVPVQFGVSPTRVCQPAAAAQVSFSDGTQARYDLVVGADGVHSTVRALCRPGARAEYGGESWWRAVVGPRPRRLSEWTLAFCVAGNLLAVPIGRDRVYLAAGVTTDEPFTDPSAGRVARLRERFRDVTAVLRDVLDLVPRQTEFALL
jgi:2-polyprenyl-6-methoxyphenol hydroxylase-like FAD-dependent oxidoreductase